MQVDGYSLDAQKDKLHKYADCQDMIITGEYSDEGKSGKSVEGRPQFQQMLSDIESGKDNVDYVLVFKLSRFGRNAADVLSFLQRMQDFGVNLICVEDGIDSSQDAGKLMVSVLSAVAEIERENILVQTMEGRRQKAREGKWNGGFAPYGYQLINGELHIAEDGAEIIRIIYDKFANTTMGIVAIATFLNNSGYKKTRAVENVCHILSVNTTGPYQTAPTALYDRSGNTLVELDRNTPDLLAYDLVYPKPNFGECGRKEISDILQKGVSDEYRTKY